jgi:hypothetical protein
MSDAAGPIPVLAGARLIIGETFSVDRSLHIMGRRPP